MNAQVELFPKTTLELRIDDAAATVTILDDQVKARSKAVESAEEKLEEARGDAYRARSVLEYLRHEFKLTAASTALEDDDGAGNGPLEPVTVDPLCIGPACGAFLGNEDGSNGVCNGVEDLNLAVPGQTLCPIVEKGGARPEVVEGELEEIAPSDHAVANAFGDYVKALAEGDLTEEDAARYNVLAAELEARGIDPADWKAIVEAGPPAAEGELIEASGEVLAVIAGAQAEAEQEGEPLNPGAKTEVHLHRSLIGASGQVAVDLPDGTTSFSEVGPLTQYGELIADHFPDDDPGTYRVIGPNGKAREARDTIQQREHGKTFRLESRATVAEAGLDFGPPAQDVGGEAA